MGTEPHSSDEPQHDGAAAASRENGAGGAPQGSDTWDDLVLDENFVKGAEVSEPTARTRMLTERWKQDGAPSPQPWRSDEPPAGWIHATSNKQRREKQKKEKPRKKRRGWFRRKKGDSETD